MNKESLKKINKARRFAWLLKKSPYIRAIFIVGSVGGGYAKKYSDIDFLIIVKDGRIFTARFFLSAITQIFGLRRYGNKISNRFCLNHYLTESNLELPYKSKYDKRAYTYGLRVLFDKNNLHQKFLFANNFDFPRLSLVDSRLSLGKSNKIILNNKIGDFFERFLKKLQIKKIKNNSLTKYANGIIIVNNKQLQFHPEAKSGIYVRDIE